MTKGEYRVNVDFNPLGDPTVTTIKALAAGLIDCIEEIPTSAGPEVGRLKALAQTHIETAAMYGVKAATKKPMPE
jgi:hypothetical protein